jgi:uncharacterized protein (DUF2267 family)
MTDHQLSTLNHMYEEANTWINEINDLTGMPDRRHSYHALRGVLFGVRDRLPLNDLFDFAVQMPTVIRGIMFEGYSPAGKPEKLDRDQFLSRVESELRASGGNQSPIEATQAVFSVMDKHLSQGAINSLKELLPDEYAAFWKAA